MVYADPAVTDIACAGLNGMRMGERTLTVRRATEVHSLAALFKGIGLGLRARHAHCAAGHLGVLRRCSSAMAVALVYVSNVDLCFCCMSDVMCIVFLG